MNAEALYSISDREGIEMPTISKEARMLYLQRRKKDLVKCREALHQKKWSVISHIGHKTKGNADTFGFQGLTPIAQQLEKAAEVQDEGAVKSTLDRLERFLESSEGSEY